MMSKEKVADIVKATVWHHLGSAAEDVVVSAGVDRAGESVIKVYVVMGLQQDIDRSALSTDMKNKMLALAGQIECSLMESDGFDDHDHLSPLVSFVSKRDISQLSLETARPSGDVMDFA